MLSHSYWIMYAHVSLVNDGNGDDEKEKNQSNRMDVRCMGQEKTMTRKKLPEP